MSSAATSPAGRPGRPVACLICLACLALYLYPLLRPVLVQDDFQILTRGATWRRTVENLWVPQNEHAMPLGRLLTFALMQTGGRATLLPWTAGLLGPLALLGALALVYRFVRRELGHPFYGLVAAAVFGVTSVYQQAVYWFAAAFSVLALDTILLALLAAQRWKETGRGLWLDVAALACFLAPCWFASGVLAGPLCCLYLLWPRRAGSVGDRSGPTPVADAPGAPGPPTRFGHATLVPLLGTLLFLAVSLPRTNVLGQRLEHHGHRPLTEVLKDPDSVRVGVVYTLRSVVDNLLLGAGGVSTVVVPQGGVVVVLVLAAVAATWWWRRAPDRRLPLLGLGMIGSGYVLVYTARAAWEYEPMTTPSWSRYHLLPQLGLTLFVVGGLPALQGRRFVLSPGGLTRPQARALMLFVGVLFVVQAPRSLLGYFVPLPGAERFARNEQERKQLIEAEQQWTDQRAVLRRIAAAEDFCRAHGIDPAAAQTVLAPLPVPGWFTDDADGWMLLRGRGGGAPPEEIRRLLESP